MKNLTQQLRDFGRTLGKSEVPVDAPALSYLERRKLYAELANKDVQQLRQETRKRRIETLHGASDLNPAWTFDSLIEDSQDAREAIGIASAFIAAHNDPEWRNSRAHMMLFYGDYGRGKSHIAGAIAHQLIAQHEVTVLYRQLQTLLEMRFFSYDFSAEDDAPEQFRELSKQLLTVELLILDEVCVNQTILKPSAQAWLGNLLRQRAMQKKNCILITNHNLEQLSNALGRYCYESIHEYETYNIEFRGPSRRQLSSDFDTSEPSDQYHPNKM